MTKKQKSIWMIPLLAAALTAQPAAKQALTMAVGANAKQIAAFQWKQKITVFRKGNPMPPIVEEIRFDASGQPHRAVLAKPEEKKMGPLRAHKAAEVKEDIEDVMQLARRYSHPQLLAEAIQKGEIWEGQGKLRVQARSVVLPADDMTIQVNAATYLAARIDIRTQFEGSPVTIAIDYQQLPNGPSMMVRMTVQIPKDSIVVNVESYDFARPAVPSVP